MPPAPMGARISWVPVVPVEGNRLPGATSTGKSAPFDYNRIQMPPMRRRPTNRENSAAFDRRRDRRRQTDLEDDNDLA
jgi:hypothetical protein